MGVNDNNFGRIALDWIRFERRIGHCYAVTPGDPFRDPIIRAFLEQQLVAYRHRTLDDAENMLAGFFKRYSDFAEWWWALLQSKRIDIRFDNGEPRVDANDFRDWRDLSSRIDPDTLIALALVREHRQVSLDDCTRWFTFITSDDYAVRRLFHGDDIKITDTHVHLEGCENIPFLWQRILTGELRRSDFAEYVMRTPTSVLPSTGSGLPPDIETECAMIASAITARRRIMAEMPVVLPPLRPPTDECKGRFWVPRDGRIPSGARREGEPSEIAGLWPERLMLMSAWRRVRRADPLDVNDRRFLIDFDRYTQGKSRFINRFIQGNEANPGLVSFRRYFDRAKVPPLRRQTRGVLYPSKRIRWQRLERLARFATESPGLRAIEFRIAPERTRAAYVAFFEEFERRIKAGRFGYPSCKIDDPDCRTSFVVHFTRFWPQRAELVSVQSGPEGGRNRLSLKAARIDEDLGRREIDRLSAVLHDFRLEHPRLARHIVGIDIANLERLNPVHVFSPYLRCLRGDCKLPKWLPPEERERWFSHWRALGNGRRAKAPPSQAPLGLTYHAGEDYFHPLDGLKAISEYLEYCGPKAGDRIGHALALGADIPEFNKRQGRLGDMPRGLALDLLVWVRRRISAFRDTEPRVVRSLDDDIAELGQEIYNGRRSPDELYAAFKLRHLSSETLFEERQEEEAVRLLKQEWHDVAVQKRREEIVPFPNSLISEYLHPAAEQLQASVVNRLIERGIHVECNPTSNMGLLGLASIAEHPIIKVVKAHRGLKLTINTDDPGTFGTRLENEYALFRSGLLENKMDVGEVDEIMSAIARASERSSFATPPHRW